MASKKLDIYGSLILHIDQQDFKNDIISFLDTLKGYAGETIKTERGAMRGITYSDFVLTIKATRDKRNCEVYRNRDGKLLFAMYDNKNASISWEYIFVQNHLKQLLKDSDEGRRD